MTTDDQTQLDTTHTIARHEGEATQSWLSDVAYWRCDCGANGSEGSLVSASEALREHLRAMEAQR